MNTSPPYSQPSKNSSIDHSKYLTPNAPSPTIKELIQTFKTPTFSKLSVRKRFKQVNQALCQFIQNASSESFLLLPLLDFFHQLNQEKILNEPLDLAAFEFWLNNFSDMSEQENYKIRAKIIGKYIPREEYQIFFPIGMGKIYQGTHFSVAHLSPDVDTMMASFWGWVDSFGARVGTGLHLWSLPGGPPDSPITSLFRNMFGISLFSSLARVTPSLTLTAMDLVTQQGLKKEFGNTLINTIGHGNQEKAILLVNEQGHYLGDWRNSDTELVRQIIILFKSCLHWFENNLHTNLISLFAKQHLSIKDFSAFHASIFTIKIKNCEPIQDFNEKQYNDLNDFFRCIFDMPEGLEATFHDFNEALDRLSMSEMLHFEQEMIDLPTTDILDAEGHLMESRPKIFNHIKDLFKHLDEAIFTLRNYVERLDVVLTIKHKVLGIPHTYITLRSDVDEMRQKMQNYDFLTVVIHEQDGSLFPVGIVRANDVKQKGLGTVSLRDFCNLEETKMASYLDVIGVIDHHKSSLRTHSVPTALIGDAQSCNVLIAEQAFALNDKFSVGGMTSQEIENDIQALHASLHSRAQTRILRRLLQRYEVSQQKNHFFIHPQREFLEYLCFLYAILDDTDLLTKVSNRDLDCVIELLNRLKSLTVGREVEIVNVDDIPRDHTYLKSATQRILQQEDMYSLYKQIFNVRESEVESNLQLCMNREFSNIFLDTKEQNGCARVGQTKMFTSNFPFFLKYAQEVRNIWLEDSQEVYREKPDIDLYIHMISTIPSADEVYSNQMRPYEHQDEIWFWNPSTQESYNHMNSFLAGFQQGIKEYKDTLSIEYIGPVAKDLIEIFTLHFPGVSKRETPHTTVAPHIVLRFKAGALNSRKSKVTPFLPRLG